MVQLCCFSFAQYLVESLQNFCSFCKRLMVETLECKSEVKMAGYWPSPFCVSLRITTESRSITTKKEGGHYLAILTKQTCSIEDVSHTPMVTMWSWPPPDHHDCKIKLIQVALHLTPKIMKKFRASILHWCCVKT